MQQLVLDISSEKDADLIKELLKRFKGVQVSSFETELSPSQINSRIKKGIKDADEGKTKPWKEVKSGLLKRIKAK
jgi:CRISPR/Cas system-associated endoribonuclease Cas2